MTSQAKGRLAELLIIQAAFAKPLQSAVDYVEEKDNLHRICIIDAQTLHAIVISLLANTTGSEVPSFNASAEEGSGFSGQGSGMSTPLLTPDTDKDEEEEDCRPDLLVSLNAAH